MKELLELYQKTRYLYEKYYDIHFCSEDEIADVISFIDLYWQKGHILTKSRELLEWQHHDKLNNRYNFVVARNKKDGEIHAIIGFILSSIYDHRIETPIRWGAIWKVRNDVAIKGLGLALKGYLEEMLPVPYIGGVGLSNDSKKIDTKLGEKMGKLEQYYIANPNLKEFKLIDNPKFPQDISSNGSKQVICLDEAEFQSAASGLKEFIVPYKSIEYYRNRYYQHPVYKYKVLGIKNNDEMEAIIVYRVTAGMDRKNIFFVDYFGKENAMEGMYVNFLSILEQENAECISFPVSGISDRKMREAGFLNKNDTNTILPVYYEPFERRNVELDYHFWPVDNKNIIIVKGDADQDRPNRLPEVYYG